MMDGEIRLVFLKLEQDMTTQTEEVAFQAQVMMLNRIRSLGLLFNQILVLRLPA